MQRPGAPVSTSSNDAESIQRRARATMTLGETEINAINVRILENMNESNFNVPMLRLMYNGASREWAAVNNIHTFYDRFRHVTRFAEKKIDDEAMSLALSGNTDWYTYVMGMLSHFKQRGLHWTIVRSRLVLTPYLRGDTAESVRHKSILEELMDPTHRPPEIKNGKVKMRSCDVEAFEYLVRVDVGLSHLHSVANPNVPSAASLVAAATLEVVQTMAKSPRPAPEFTTVSLASPRAPPALPPIRESRKETTPSEASSSSSSSSSEDSSDSDSDGEGDTWLKMGLSSPLPVKKELHERSVSAGAMLVSPRKVGTTTTVTLKRRVSSESVTESTSSTSPHTTRHLIPVLAASHDADRKQQQQRKAALSRSRSKSDLSLRRIVLENAAENAADVTGDSPYNQKK